MSGILENVQRWWSNVLIAYGTYYDHIARGGYRPDVCAANWGNCDVGVIFGGDMDEVEIIRSYKLPQEIINIEFKISVPTDIPIAYNKCTQYLWDVIGADWVVWCSGDEYITRAGDDYLYKCMEDGVTGAMPIMHHMLYAPQYCHANTLSIMNTKDRIIFDETADGEGCEIMPPRICADDNTMFLDFGYLGTPQYSRKMDNHRYIWGEDDHKTLFLKLWNAGRKNEAVMLVYKALKDWGGTLEEINLEVYGELIERLDLMEDYKYCLDYLHACQV